jgi:hypothetical protein
VFVPKLIPPDVKAQVRRLRAEGLSINRIATQLGIAKSSVSGLVRDIPLKPEQQKLLRRSETARAQRRQAQLVGRSFAQLNDPDYAAGVMLYWAEGAKARNHAHIANADAELLRLWLG